MSTIRLATLALFALLPITAGCLSTSGVADEPGSNSANTTGLPLHLCAAIHGNGPRIPAHFGALARITEEFGVLDAAAGGSSSTITMFLYESMLLNPSLRACSSGRPDSCTDEDVRSRLSLLLKSFLGYGPALARTYGLSEAISKLERTGFHPSSISSDPEGAATAILDVLDSMKPADVVSLADYINPEVLAQLTASVDGGAPDPHGIREAYDAIAQFGKFEVTNNRLLFREGLLNWQTATEIFGRAADFYAGYGPTDQAAFRLFLDSCAPLALGKPWSEIESLSPSGESWTCGEAFASLAEAYRSAASDRHARPFASRLDEPIAAHFPALGITSVLEGRSAEAFRSALHQYKSGMFPGSESVPQSAFPVSFEDVKIGYWSSDVLLSALSANALAFSDPKTTKARALGQAAWRTILELSPAEPGLARIQSLDSERFSAGGWPDPAPVQALKNVGCEHVIYIQREDMGDGPPDFAARVAAQLGASESDLSGQFGLETESNSAMVGSLRAADAVWCTKWDEPAVSDPLAVTATGYDAELQSRDTFFSSSETPARASLGRVACTPGVTGQ